MWVSLGGETENGCGLLLSDLKDHGLNGLAAAWSKACFDKLLDSREAVAQ